VLDVLLGESIEVVGDVGVWGIEVFTIRGVWVCVGAGRMVEVE
jgi:hypothetical protein